MASASRLRLLHTAWHHSGKPVFITGFFTAVMQTVLFREIFSVVSGNEVIIGTLFAVWLAATAGGAVLGGRFPGSKPGMDCRLLLPVGCAALTGIRAVRLLLSPGEDITPLLLLVLLLCTVAPVAMLGGHIFGSYAGTSRTPSLYRWEQAGSLVGLLALSISIGFLLPDSLIAAGGMLLLIPLYTRWRWRCVAMVFPLLLVVTGHVTASWKYPVRVDTIRYAPEGEVATAIIDGKETVLLNGTVFRSGFATPAIEQSVYGPLSIRRNVRRILLINDAGQLAHARKYNGAYLRCIRTDQVIVDTCCPHTEIEDVVADRPFDAVILGCGMPDVVSASRYFTTSFYRRMHQLTGDSGVFSVTLPFPSEFLDRRDRMIRDIVMTTLQSVFIHVFVLPGEGLTFIASDAAYSPPDTCYVQNDYFEQVILAACTKERLREANVPPVTRTLHTTSHPQLLSAAAGRYLTMFKVQWWMYVALPLVTTLLLLSIPSMRSSLELLSVGSSGFCTGVFAITLMLLFQAVYGTVYSHVSLLLCALSAGFTAGAFIRRFPRSDMVIGSVLGGFMVALGIVETPAPLLFYLGNAAAGFVTAAQFVTRKKMRIANLYAVDCVGGVLGMALASTVLIPLFGVTAVAIGIAVVKGGIGLFEGKV